MTKPGYTAIAMIVDESSSMGGIRTSVLEGLTKVRDEQAKLPGSVTFDYALFASDYRQVVSMQSPQAFRPTLNPDGMTALYDAIVLGVTDFRQAIERLPADQRPEFVQVIVATDGDENASRNADALLVKDTIQWHAQNLGWDFTFLGANQDAVFAGAALGFEGKKSMTFGSTAAGVSGATSSLSDYIASVRRGEDASYSDDQRTAAVK